MLARDPDRARTLLDPRVEIAVGDLRTPSTLDVALRAIDRVLLLAANTPDQLEMETNVIGETACRVRDGDGHSGRPFGVS